MEITFGIIIIFFTLFVMTIVLLGCDSYRKEIKIEIQKEEIEKLKKPASIGEELTAEQVLKIVEDKMFWDTIREFGDKGKFEGEKFDNSDYVEILVPCEYSNCPCHPSREDCCKTFVEKDGFGYCKMFINISKLCNVEENKEEINDPKILTNEEIKILGDILSRYGTI